MMELKMLAHVFACIHAVSCITIGDASDLRPALERRTLRGDPILVSSIESDQIDRDQLDIFNLPHREGFKLSSSSCLREFNEEDLLLDESDPLKESFASSNPGFR